MLAVNSEDDVEDTIRHYQVFWNHSCDVQRIYRCEVHCSRQFQEAVRRDPVEATSLRCLHKSS